jgi:ribonuclease BN (tRNA processing enzyme)
VARDADVLIHDAQYTEEEYPGRIGWGHSSVRHAVEFSRICRVGRLIMFHHDPLHTDEKLEEMRAEAVELWGDGSEPPVLAAEGMELDLAQIESASA